LQDSWAAFPQRPGDFRLPRRNPSTCQPRDRIAHVKTPNGHSYRQVSSTAGHCPSKA
jgi:hypothetical protein